VLTPALLYFMTLLVPVVMLNALIAIMGDTFDRVSETRKQRGLQLRAQLLLELDDTRDDQKQKDPKLYPRCLHVIRLKEDAETEESWAGRLSAMKDKIVDVKKTVESKISTVESKISTVESKISTVESTLKGEISTVQSKIDDVQIKLLAEMGKIMSALEAAGMGDRNVLMP